MNKKLIGAVLGTLTFGPLIVPAFADDKPPAEGEKAPAKKEKKGKKGDKKEGGEKSCGADGKSCSGKK
jgi:hypothetical protein